MASFVVQISFANHTGVDKVARLLSHERIVKHSAMFQGPDHCDYVLSLKTEDKRIVSDCPTWGFPKIRGTLLGVPVIRIIIFGGLYWGPLILGNYHIVLCSHALALATMCLARRRMRMHAGELKKTGKNHNI